VQVVQLRGELMHDCLQHAHIRAAQFLHHGVRFHIAHGAFENLQLRAQRRLHHAFDHAADNRFGQVRIRLPHNLDAAFHIERGRGAVMRIGRMEKRCGERRNLCGVYGHGGRAFTACLAHVKKYNTGLLIANRRLLLFYRFH